MPDSVRERIMKNIYTALTQITVANGFASTLVAVERLLQRGQSSQAPMAYLIEGDDAVSVGPLGGSFDLLSRVLNVNIVLIVQQDDDVDSRSASEVMNNLIADVQKKMQEDPRRGDLAINTEEASAGAVRISEGIPELSAIMDYRILYRHRRIDPTIAG